MTKSNAVMGFGGQYSLNGTPLPSLLPVACPVLSGAFRAGPCLLHDRNRLQMDPRSAQTSTPVYSGTSVLLGTCRRQVVASIPNSM